MHTLYTYEYIYNIHHYMHFLPLIFLINFCFFNFLSEFCKGLSRFFSHLLYSSWFMIEFLKYQYFSMFVYRVIRLNEISKEKSHWGKQKIVSWKEEEFHCWKVLTYRIPIFFLRRYSVEFWPLEFINSFQFLNFSNLTAFTTTAFSLISFHRILYNNTFSTFECLSTFFVLVRGLFRKIFLFLSLLKNTLKSKSSLNRKLFFSSN